MKEFPNSLNVRHKSVFKKLNYDRLKCYLRRDLYEHIISKDETDYFSLDQFNGKVGNLDTVKKMVSELIPELEELGWKCRLAYGGTGLFIYSTEKPPANCYTDSF